MTLDQFVTAYTGESLTNNHGGYAGECVSLAARFAQEVQNVPNADGVLYCQTTGGARDLYENPTALTMQYYDKIPNGQPRQKADLVVWGANLGKYGDVAVALDSGTQIFGQLGTPVFIPANIRSETRPPLGYLRLKGTDMPPFNEGDRVNINQYLYGKDIGRFSGAVGKDWKDAIYFGIFETADYKTDALINAGDVPAIEAALGTKDGATQVGKTWKDFFYYYVDPNSKATYTQVDFPVFKKN